MTRFAQSVVLVGCLWALIATPVASHAAAKAKRSGKVAASAATKGTSRQSKQSRARAPAKAKRKMAQRRPRLPRLYSKLELSDAQREKILDIQATYRAKSQDLRKQLDAIVSGRDRDLARVLKPAQRAKLKQIAANRSSKEGKGRETASKRDKASKKRPKT
ncbi:MAG: hypothetical protein ACC645_01095 [Pirellulales bacterium]